MSYSDFERGISSKEIERRKRDAASADRAAAMMRRWKESERILGILRSIEPHSHTVTPDCMSTWYSAVQGIPFEPGDLGDGPERVESPNQWFFNRFPEQVTTYGYPFFEDRDIHGQFRPSFINADFFGAAMGGEAALGHRVVFVPDEDSWYFWDPRVEAFRRTTAEKIECLASNYLIKCTQSFRRNDVALPLITEFRAASVMRNILGKAKTVLRAESSFFNGPTGNVRMIDGKRLNPKDEPPHRLFVKNDVEPKSGALLRVSDANARYQRYCRAVMAPPLTPAQFKIELSGLIYETFNFRLRHDIPDSTGKHQHGWRGLALRES